MRIRGKFWLCRQNFPLIRTGQPAHKLFMKVISLLKDEPVLFFDVLIGLLKALSLQG